MSLLSSLKGYLIFRRSLGSLQLKSLARRYWGDALRMQEIIAHERSKRPSRTEIINYCIQNRKMNRYLEIGVRNPDHNFNLIICQNKVSVDPGLAFKANPVDFPMTSDDFYSYWLTHIKTVYDLIFIDGLHRAEQVSRDIRHALEMTSSSGLIVLHDCNPPHAEFARERYDYDGVAEEYWNGTTWKAAWEFFFSGSYALKVVDSDWGVGIIDKSKTNASKAKKDLFFEFDEFTATKRDVGYLCSWEEAMTWLQQ